MHSLLVFCFAFPLISSSASWGDLCHDQQPKNLTHFVMNGILYREGSRYPPPLDNNTDGWGGRRRVLHSRLTVHIEATGCRSRVGRPPAHQADSANTNQLHYLSPTLSCPVNNDTSGTRRWPLWDVTHFTRKRTKIIDDHLYLFF